MWSPVAQARWDGLLTEEEYEVLRDAIGPPPPVPTDEDRRRADKVARDMPWSLRT